MIKQILILFIGITLFSCKEPQYNKAGTNLSEKISDSVFSNKSELKGTIINIEGVLDPFRYHVIRDSLLVIEYNRASPFYFEAYNLNNKDKLFKFGRNGKGPNEILTGKLISNTDLTSNKSELYVYDVVKSKLLKFNIDSLISSKNYKNVEHIKLPQYATSFSKFSDNSFLCYNSYFIDSENLKNDTDKIFLYNINKKKTPDISGCKYFTFNVSAGIVFSSQSRRRSLVADRYNSKLDVYDENLKLIKSVVGPEITENEFVLENNQVYFKKGKAFKGYNSGTVVNDNIYLVYEGVVGGYDFNDSSSTPNVKVLKFDWNGNLVDTFVLDRFIYTISITADEKQLYGTSVGEMGKKILVKYDLI